MNKLFTLLKNIRTHIEVNKCATVLFLLVSVFAESQAQTQRRVKVPEGFGTLNQVIDNDTIPGGARVNPNTIYVLLRGGVYLLSGTIRNPGFHLTLEAEEGNGPRPFVMMGLLEGNIQPDQTFEVFGNLTMRSIHTTSINEASAFRQRIITITAASRITLTDCIFDRAGQALLRVASNGVKIYLRNSTVSRIGLPNDPDNGRVVDNRGVTIDSLVIENNTIYNITSTLLRDGGIGAPNGGLRYGLVNQNTIMNMGQRLAAFGLMTTGARLSFTNNIVVNHRYQGNSATATTPAIDFTVPAGNTPTISFNNNNFFYQTQVQQTWAEPGIALVTPPLSLPANAGRFTANTSATVAFSGITPAPPLDIIRKIAQNQTTTAPYWDWTGANPANPWELNALAYHSFSFPSSLSFYTQSTTGEPIGSLRWHTGFEVPATLKELVSKANLEIQKQLFNPIINSSAAALTALQSSIANANAVLQNAGSTHAQVFTANTALTAALQNFKASFIITGAEEDLTKKIRFYPNPASSYIYVPNPPNNRIKNIVMLSFSGQELKRLAVGSQDLVAISIGDLSPSTYVIQFELESNQRIIQKLIKVNE
jgi:hypothetical protein